MYRFERRLQGRRRVEETTIELDDPRIEETIPPALLKQLKEDLEILDGAGPAFDLDAVLAGNMTPVFFGSAMTNFGVEPFLRAFLKYAALP